ncbi:hypothetical protein HDV04_002829 [Boothiomyces sp. JEL0838]|nr:hypothetical protein HDV04_002829 [Boothiomyces sp. JEL0838]
MLIHGTLYWAFQFTSSIADIESPEQNLDFEDSEFVFPESPTYNKTPHLTIAGQELSPTTNSNTQITMGTSAPITIAVQSFRKTSSIDNLSVPRTFPLEKINESAHLEHQDTYRYYLKRHAELATAIKYIQSQNANEATKLLTSHSRHLILPRFALQLIEAIALVLSDSVTLDMHRLASHNLSPKGSPDDLPDEDPETLFINQSLLQRYLILKVFRRLGLIDFAQSNCARNLKVTNDIFANHFKFEMATMHCLKQEYKEAQQIFDEIWKKYLEHEDSSQLVDLDHSSGLFLSAIDGYLGDQIAALRRLEKINLELSKALTNNVIKLEKATISWCLENRRVDPLVIYWLLFIRGELSSIAGSRSCIPILINLAIKLNIDYTGSEFKSNTLNAMYRLVLATLLKYLVIHKVEAISHFSDIYTCDKLSDLVSNLYTEGIAIAKDLPYTHKNLGIHHQLLFEFAEFHCTYLRNWNEAHSFMKDCLSDISNTNNHVRSRSTSKSPNVPSFARPHDQRRTSSRSFSGQPLSVGSDGPLSTSISSHNLDWGMDSRISEVGGLEDMDHEFELKCKNVLKLLSKYTIQ